VKTLIKKRRRRIMFENFGIDKSEKCILVVI
jgi:hypothetical protein